MSLTLRLLTKLCLAVSSRGTIHKAFEISAIITAFSKRIVKPTKRGKSRRVAGDDGGINVLVAFNGSNKIS